MKAYGDIDPDAARLALQELERFQQQERDTKAAVEKAIAESNRTHEQERNVLLKHVAEHIAVNEIRKAGGDEILLLPHVLPFIKPEVKIGRLFVQVLDEFGKPRLDPASGANLPVATFVSELKKRSAFQKAFEASSREHGVSNQTSGSAPKNGEYFQQQEGFVRLTREAAKNPRIYRDAVKQAGGPGRVIIDQE